MNLLKFYSSLIIVLSSVPAYAGVSWINYDTGYYQCTNGFRGYEYSCHNKNDTFQPLSCKVIVTHICDV